MSDLPYIPIDCDFHDEFEAAATVGRPVTLALSDGRTLHDVIIDLGHELAGEATGEYMTLRSGERVRFDRIVSIDGKLRPV